MSTASIENVRHDMHGDSPTLEWFRRAHRYAAVPKEFRAAGTSGVTLLRVCKQPPGFYRRPTGKDLGLEIVLSNGGSAARDHGVRFHCERLHFGQLFLPPPQTIISYDVSSSLDFMLAAIPPSVVSSALTTESGAPSTGDFGRLHTGPFRDAAITELVLRLWRDAENEIPQSAMFVEQAWNTIVQLLLSDSGRVGETGPRPRIRDWRMRRAVEYLDARIGEDVGLAEVAAEVDLSPSHFAALFRAGTGEPPHRWLLRRRLERASELLVHPRQSVTEIAHACGFASSQHLATAFRKHHGMTPTEYRQDRLSSAGAPRN